MDSLWCWGSGVLQRDKNQKAVICASISLGIAQGFVSICNACCFRERPVHRQHSLAASIIFVTRIIVFDDPLWFIELGLQSDRCIYLTRLEVFEPVVDEAQAFSYRLAGILGAPI